MIVAIRLQFKPNNPEAWQSILLITLINYLKLFQHADSKQTWPHSKTATGCGFNGKLRRSYCLFTEMVLLLAN